LADAKLLLSILKARAQCTSSLSVLEKLDVFSVCLAAEMYVARTNGGPEIIINGTESRYGNI